MDNMLSGENIGDNLKNYKIYEIQLHRELMNNCRKYLNHLGIVSIVGILDIVKQEVIELERATTDVPNEEHRDENQQ